MAALSEEITKPSEPEVLEIDLRTPWIATTCAWLFPGAGHFYQRRYVKGTIFMVCILSTYFAGLIMGGGHVVYASWVKNDMRWHYLFQVGVGLPALPAVVQCQRERQLGGLPDYQPWFNGWMAPPAGVNPDGIDQLAHWRQKYGALFELGTLYTIIAGLLNVLAIFDAQAGPLILTYEQEQAESKAIQKRMKFN